MKRAAVIAVAVTMLFCLLFAGCGRAEDGKITEKNSAGTTNNTVGSNTSTSTPTASGTENRSETGTNRNGAEGAVSDALNGATNAVSDVVSGAEGAVTDAGRALENGARDIVGGRR